MNRLAGEISRIDSNEALSLVEVRIAETGDAVISVVLDTPESALYLKTGNPVAVLFKESEVMLAPVDLGPLSVRNRLRCRISGREAGKLLTHFRLEYGGTALHALITTVAAMDLELRDGDEVLALVKSMEISLATEDGPAGKHP